MRARPREHYRSDTITSSGNYRSPSTVNEGVYPTRKVSWWKSNPLRFGYGSFNKPIYLKPFPRGGLVGGYRELNKRDNEAQKRYEEAQQKAHWDRLEQQRILQQKRVRA